MFFFAKLFYKSRPLSDKCVCFCTVKDRVVLFKPVHRDPRYYIFSMALLFDIPILGLAQITNELDELNLVS